MTRTIGVEAAEHIAVGLVEDNKLVGARHVFPQSDKDRDFLNGMPADEIVETIARLVELARDGQEIAAVGVGFPGIIQNGIVEDSPNLQQAKGLHLADKLTAQLLQQNTTARVHALNDTDAVTAGIAATLGHLDRFIRVWWLGAGIGFGRYPQTEGIWEGGHGVVALDPKETFCSCGGVGHLEGIMGYRAMRLRFLDLEPEEVFAHAKDGDERCVEFVKLWHRALAAATATSIHMDGAGKFFISGPNAQYLDTGLLDLYVHDMVKMSPLQGSAFEIVPTSDDTAIIGAAVSAERAVK